MSLNVRRCVFDEDGDWDFIEGIDYSETLAGFESWRTVLWGSPLVIRLGCVILPELRHSDLYCYPDDLPLLLRDTDIILANVALLASNLKTNQELVISAPITDLNAAMLRNQDQQSKEEIIAHRTHNIRNATLWAIEHGGMVLIW